MALSDDQKTRIIALLREGRGRDEIASVVGVAPGSVSAIKAHITMGSYGVAAASDQGADELIEAAEITFGLEHDLQKALRSNIEQLGAGLTIIDAGKERITDAGRIDITAREANGDIVVIELKAGEAAPEALTQLLAYMGAVRRQEHVSVRGVLIAGDFHPRIVFAVQAVPNVQLKRYRYKFTFESVE
jgi:RecB family endonuclease NucS